MINEKSSIPGMSDERSLKNLLTATAVIEGAAGLILVILPSAAATLLLSALPYSKIADIFARVAGLALLSLGIACWLSRDTGMTSAGRGLIISMLIYNTGIIVVLVYTGAILGISSGGLWLFVLVHIVMTAWCILSLRKK